MLYFQVDLNVDQLLLNLTVEQYQLCRGLLEGILSCFARQPVKAIDKDKEKEKEQDSTAKNSEEIATSNSALDISLSTTMDLVPDVVVEDGNNDDDSDKEDNDEEFASDGENDEEPEQEAPSFWDRFKSILYRGGPEEQTSTDEIDVLAENLAMSPPDSSDSDSDDDSEYQSCEETDETGFQQQLATELADNKDDDNNDLLTADKGVSALWSDLNGKELQRPASPSPRTNEDSLQPLAAASSSPKEQGKEKEEVAIPLEPSEPSKDSADVMEGSSMGDDLDDLEEVRQIYFKRTFLYLRYIRIWILLMMQD